MTEAKTEHGGNGWYWDNLGNEWKMECLCGFMTVPNPELMTCGDEMDEHLREASL